MADDSLNLLIRLQSENNTAKDMKQMMADMQAIEKEIQKLSQVASGAKIDPAMSTESAKTRVAALKGEYEKLKTSAEEVGKATKAALGDGANSPLNRISMEARIKSLNELSEGFNKVAGGLISLGKGAIDEAVKIGKFEAIIKSASKSSKEAAGAIKYLNTYSMSAQPFKMESVYQAGVSLVKLKQNVQDLLPKIADLASAFKKDIGETADVVGRALAGNQRSLRILEFQYGINKKVLVEYGAELKKNGTINMAATESQEALVKAMEKYSGKASEAANGYGAAFTRLNNEISNFKVQIGKELIPVITDMVHTLTSGAKGASELGIEFKSLLSSTILIGGGITILASSFMGAVTKVAAFKTALAELGTTMSLSVGIFAGVAIAAGILGNTLINEWNRINQLRADKIIDESKKMASAFKQARDAIEEGKKGPIKIAFSVDKATLEKDLEDIKAKVAAAKDLLVSETSNPYYFKDLQIVKDKLKALYDTGKIGAQEYEQRLSDVNEREQKTIANLSAENKGQGEYLATLIETNNTYEEAKKVQDSYFYKVIENIGNATKQIGQYSQAIKNSVQKETIDDKSFNAKLQYYKDDISHLRSYKTEYALSATQLEALDKTINSAKEQRLQDQKKQQSEVLQKQTEEYEDFDKTQKMAIAKKEITEKQYYDNLKKYMDKHASDLKQNADLKYSIELTYFTGIGALADKEKAEKEKAAEEAAESAQKATDEAIKKAQEEAERKEKVRKEAEEKRVRAEEEVQGKIDDLQQSAFQSEVRRIEEQRKNYEAAGVSRVKIEKLTQMELQKLAKDTLDEFKKNENDKQKELEDTKKKIEETSKALDDARRELQEQQNSTFLNSGIMTAEEALSSNKDGLTQADRDIKKYKELLAAQDKVKTLTQEKIELEKTEVEQQKELQKIQKDREETQKSINSLMGDAADLTGKEASANDSIVSSLKNMIALRQQYNDLLNKSGGSGGGTGGGTGGSGSDKSQTGGSEKTATEGSGEGNSSSSNYFSLSSGGEDLNEMGKRRGFENPANDRSAFNAGKAVVNRSIADMSRNFLQGMVSGVSETKNTFNNSNSNTNNYKYINQHFNVLTPQSRQEVAATADIRQQATQLSDALRMKTRRRL